MPLIWNMIIVWAVFSVYFMTWSGRLQSHHVPKVQFHFPSSFYIIVYNSELSPWQPPQQLCQEKQEKNGSMGGKYPNFATTESETTPLCSDRCTWKQLFTQPFASLQETRGSVHLTFYRADSRFKSGGKGIEQDFRWKGCLVRLSSWLWLRPRGGGGFPSLPPILLSFLPLC